VSRRFLTLTPKKKDFESQTSNQNIQLFPIKIKDDSPDSTVVASISDFASYQITLTIRPLLNCCKARCSKIVLLKIGQTNDIKFRGLMNSLA